MADCFIIITVNPYIELTLSYGKSGYYLIRESDTLTFFRCGNFKKKGSPDQLHLDVWYKGKNILFDSGTYKYNASPKEIRYFRGTESHNTVMIDDFDQLLKGPRFMWLDIPTVKSVEVSETESEYIIEGKVCLFKHLGKAICVSRKITKKKGESTWTIVDHVDNLPFGRTLRQFWHTMPDSRIVFDSSGSRVETHKAFSSYYGTKEECCQIEFQTNKNKITTKISL